MRLVANWGWSVCDPIWKKPMKEVIAEGKHALKIQRLYWFYWGLSIFKVDPVSALVSCECHLPNGVTPLKFNSLLWKKNGRKTFSGAFPWVPMDLQSVKSTTPPNANHVFPETRRKSRWRNEGLLDNGVSILNETTSNDPKNRTTLWEKSCLDFIDVLLGKK